MIAIELSDEDALVLFDFLARHDEIDNNSPSGLTEFQIEDPAERYTLWHLHQALEQILVTPFSADYRAEVDAARAAVRVQWGHIDDAV